MQSRAKARVEFRARLERDKRRLGWTVARVPFDPTRTWPEMVRRRVAGEINGAAFRTSLFPDGQGGFFLLVNREMQRAAGVSLEDSAAFALWPDHASRPARLPGEFASLLEDQPGLRNWFDGFTASMRREVGKWLAEPKSENARMRRARQMAERLLAAKEAEEELPPQIRLAFRERPRARLGWEKMTANQRRNELLAVFYYQQPDTRQRRIGKLCDTAEKHAI